MANKSIFLLFSCIRPDKKYTTTHHITVSQHIHPAHQPTQAAVHDVAVRNLHTEVAEVHPHPSQRSKVEVVADADAPGADDSPRNAEVVEVDWSDTPKVHHHRYHHRGTPIPTPSTRKSNTIVPCCSAVDAGGVKGAKDDDDNRLSRVVRDLEAWLQW